MGRHGQGEVPVPARVAADLVVVRTALVFRRLTTFLDGPAGVRDSDQLVERGLGGRVGDVVGDPCGIADAVAGQDPVLAVGAAPGPDLQAGQVVDPQAVGVLAARAALPLLPGQIGHQVVQPMVHCPSGDDGVVAGGGHDVEDVGLLPLFERGVGGSRYGGRARVVNVVCPEGGGTGGSRSQGVQ